MRRICMLVFLFVFVSVFPSFAADPFTVHEAGFGPNIMGLQLGTPMTWSGMIATQRNIVSRPRVLVPGTPPISNPAIFGLIIADNYKAASHRWTFAKYPTKLPGKWLVVSFQGDGRASLSNSGGGAMAKVPKSGGLDDLFVILKKNGLSHIAGPNIMVRDDRVLQYSLEKSEFSTNAATVDDFAQWLNNTYSLGTMTPKNKGYEVSNPAEGWRVLITEGEVQVFSMPLPENPKK